MHSPGRFDTHKFRRASEVSAPEVVRHKVRQKSRRKKKKRTKHKMKRRREGGGGERRQRRKRRRWLKDPLPEIPPRRQHHLFVQMGTSKPRRVFESHPSPLPESRETGSFLVPKAPWSEGGPSVVHTVVEARGQVSSALNVPEKGQMAWGMAVGSKVHAAPKGPQKGRQDGHRNVKATKQRAQHRHGSAGNGKGKHAREGSQKRQRANAKRQERKRREEDRRRDPHDL